MKIRHLIFILPAFSASICAFAAEAITVDESRPLDKLALKLVQRYGYLVTYEEAPYDESGLSSGVGVNACPIFHSVRDSTVFVSPQSAKFPAPRISHAASR